MSRGALSRTSPPGLKAPDAHILLVCLAALFHEHHLVLCLASSSSCLPCSAFSCSFLALSHFSPQLLNHAEEVFPLLLHPQQLPACLALFHRHIQIQLSNELLLVVSDPAVYWACCVSSCRFGPRCGSRAIAVRDLTKCVEDVRSIMGSAGQLLLSRVLGVCV